MKMPLSRTAAKLLHKTRGLIFDKGNFQKTLDLRRLHALEDSMGFRGQFEEHRRFQIDMLKSHGLQPHHAFLELGCGPLTAGIPVIGYLNAGNYVGVDIRNSVLDMDWLEIGRAGLSARNPRLICSSSFGAETLGEQKFDFVYSFSVLYHLSDEILDGYFGAVASRLKSSGIGLANVNVHIPSDQWLEFPFIKRSVELYADLAGKHGIEVTNLGEIKDLGFRNAGTEKHNPLLRFKLRS